MPEIQPEVQPAARPRRARTMSLSRQLIAGVLLTELLLASALLVVLVLYTQRLLLSAFDSMLQERAMATAALVRYSEKKPFQLVFDATLQPPSPNRLHPDFYRVQETGGPVIAADWPAGLPPATSRTPTVSTWHGVHYRSLRLTQLPVLDTEENLPGPAPKLTVSYASPMLSIEQRVLDAAIFAGAAGLLLLAATGLLTIWGIRRGLAPLRRLAGQAAEISALNWEFRPPPAARDTAELAPLIAALESMLSRLHQSFLRQREFLGNAAHELKTPVAIMKSTLQSLLQRPRDNQAYRLGLEQSLEDLERLQLLLDRMLRLERIEQAAESGAASRLPEVSLAAGCAAALERLQELAQARQIETKLVVKQDALVRAEGDDLELIWTNLIENAVKYSPSGSRVEIRVEAAGGEARISVEDEGPGIAAADLPRIFDRFYRGDPSRNRGTGGFGLGLAIVKSLVEAYRGKIRVESRRPAGLRFIVELPAHALPEIVAAPA